MGWTLLPKVLVPLLPKRLFDFRQKLHLNKQISAPPCSLQSWSSSNTLLSTECRATIIVEWEASSVTWLAQTSSHYHFMPLLYSPLCGISAMQHKDDSNILKTSWKYHQLTKKNKGTFDSVNRAETRAKCLTQLFIRTFKVISKLKPKAWVSPMDHWVSASCPRCRRSSSQMCCVMGTVLTGHKVSITKQWKLN